MTFVTVRLHDEMPNLGSGVRVLAITSRDAAWVHLRCPTTGATGKVSPSVWGDMKPTEVRRYRKRYVSEWWRKNAPVSWLSLNRMAA